MAEQDRQGDDPKSPIEDSVRAMFRTGRYAEAVPFIQERVAASPEDIAALELLADALRFTGDKAGAAGALVTAAELYAKGGMVIQSVAAKKRVMKLGVDPDFSAVRRVAATSASARPGTPLFDDLGDEEFAELASRLESHAYEPGQTVITEGAPGDSMFVVVRGHLEVFTQGATGDIKLAELSAGDFFGEVALLYGKPRTATIKARADAECLELSRTAFDELTARFPATRELMEEFTRKRAESTIETLIKRRRT